jgi:glycosyltransferase involved in cell wall biosynthesis
MDSAAEHVSQAGATDNYRSSARPEVVAIIPAFNEGPRIESVISVASGSELFTSVVVVDDGSSDNTALVAEQAGAVVLRLKQNSGKPAAMLAGLKATHEPVICFLDADLLAITSEHLRQLVEPVVSGQEDAQLAVFKGGRSATTLAQLISPMLSGQRCLRRSLLDGFTEWESGFGIETAINAWLGRMGVNQAIVFWYGAAQVMKEEKRGLVAGALARINMYVDIVRAWIKSKTER